MTSDVTISVDGDTAAVLLGWLQREQAIDDFKWAANRPGDRVALARVLSALSESDPGIAADAARARLEATLPPAQSRGIPEDVQLHAPEHIRRRLAFAPPGDDIVMRVANRLDMLGASHTGVGWQTDESEGYVEVGLDPYSEETAQSIRLMCEPHAVRFVKGPRRP
jgi:hypothetical protein